MGKFSYQGTGLEDNISIVPFAQILNPVKHPFVGMGIKKDQADLAGFKPVKGWELNKIMMGDDQQECYICTSPRLIILSRSELLMVRESEIIKYDATRKEEGFKALSYAVVMFLDEKNNPISDLPFRVKTTKTAGKSFRDNYIKWQLQLLSAYKSIEGSTEGLSWSAGVFAPTFVKSQSTSPDGNKINISEINSFVAITPTNLEANFILPTSKLGQELPNLKKLIKDWCNLIKVAEEDSPAEEEIKIDRNQLLTEISDKFNQLDYSFEEKKEFVASHFEDCFSLSDLSDEQLVTASSLLDVEFAKKKKAFEEKSDVPF